MSCLFGDNRDIFFPVLSEDKDMLNFVQIAENYLEEIGYHPHYCSSEEEARSKVESCQQLGSWPCYFSDSDTTGEKAYEEFYTENEVLDLNKFSGIGIIKNESSVNTDATVEFMKSIRALIQKGTWGKTDLVDLFNKILPEFDYQDKGKYLDAKM
jgi:hypothetical protein